MIKVIKKAKTIEDGIENMISAMVDDYRTFCDSMYRDRMEKYPKNKEEWISLRERDVKKFKDNFRWSKGKKYIKVINENAVNAFIVPENGLYPKGTILKAASWNCPAKHSRGNVLDGNYPIEWTGPIYLK